MTGRKGARSTPAPPPRGNGQEHGANGTVRMIRTGMVYYRSVRSRVKALPHGRMPESARWHGARQEAILPDVAQA